MSLPDNQCGKQVAYAYLQSPPHTNYPLSILMLAGISGILVFLTSGN